MNRKPKQVSLEPYGFTLVRREPVKSPKVETATPKISALSEVAPPPAPVFDGFSAQEPNTVSEMPPKKNNSAGCLIVFIVAVVITIFLAALSPSTNGTSYTDTDYDAGMACIMAEKIIKPQLKAPSTAEFDYSDCKASATHSGNTWTLRTYVDADNSFGAHIRTHFVAKITNDPPSDMWYLVDVTFDEP